MGLLVDILIEILNFILPVIFGYLLHALVAMEVCPAYKEYLIGKRKK